MTLRRAQGERLSLAEKWVKQVLHRPKTVLAAAVLLALGAAVPLYHFHLDADVGNLLPAHSQSAQAFAGFSRNFTAEQQLIVLVEDSNPARLPEFATRYASALEKLSSVAEVRFRLSAQTATFLRDHLLALLDENDLAALPERTTAAALRARMAKMRSMLTAPGGSAMAPFLSGDPLDLLSVVGPRLGQSLTANSKDGTFVSPDGKALVMFVRSKSHLDIDACKNLLQQATRIATDLGAEISQGEFVLSGKAPVVGFTGAAAFAPNYRDWLHFDLTLSTTISIVVVLFLFAAYFRALRILPLVGIPLLLALTWTASLAQLALGHVSAVSLAFATILLAIGIDIPIQLYNRVREVLATKPFKAALRDTFAELFFPSLIASLAPAAVFFCCLLSDYRGIAELGFLAGLGVLINWLAMVTVFPSLLSALPSSWWAASTARFAQDERFSEGLLFRLGNVATRSPRRLLALAAVAALIACPLAARLRIEPQLTSLQPQNMIPARVQRELESRFGERSHAAIVLVDGETPEPALLLSDRWQAELERLRQGGLLTGYQSLSTLVSSQETEHSRRAQLQSLAPVEMKKRIEAALHEAGFELEPFAPFLRQLENPPTLTIGGLPSELGFLLRTHYREFAGGKTNLATFVYLAEGKKSEAMRALSIFAKTNGGVVTGAPALEHDLGKILSNDARRIVLAAVIAVALLLALYYRRWRSVAAVLLPLLLGWLLFAAIMAVFIPINLFDLLALPLVIGYGIDDQVFLLHRYQQTGDGGTTLATTG